MVSDPQVRMIRALLEEDREPVLSLLRAAANFSPDEIAIAEELMRVFLEQPHQKDYHVYVADMGDAQAPEVAGFLVVGPVPATTGTWHMYWIAAHPRHHGKGIAQALEAHAESVVRSRNGYWLLAETSSQPGYERARGFYRKQGYVALLQIPDYYKPSDDLVIFGKRL